MSKLKTTFFCQNCGTQYSKWQGQCNACKQWNTIVEEVIQKEEKQAWKPSSGETKRAPKPLKITEIDSAAELRLDTGDGELNSFDSWEFDGREYQLGGTSDKGLPAEWRHCV